MFVRLLWFAGIVIVLVIVLILGIITALSMGRKNRISDLQPTPTPALTPIPPITPSTNPLYLTPTPTTASTFQGTITGISLHPVAYKNSTIVTVQEQSGTTVNVYVNAQTSITDQNNQPLDLPQLNDGMKVSVQGNPTEGGIDASAINVLSAL